MIDASVLIPANQDDVPATVDGVVLALSGFWQLGKEGEEMREGEERRGEERREGEERRGGRGG
jgi:hypothetical protein